MPIGRIVGKGTKSALALALVVLGLTWLNLVAAEVMPVGGSCGGGGATPCPGGAWMAPVGLFAGLIGLGLYLVWRPAGSPQLILFAWPALFGSLGVQFLRAAAAETSAYGFWLCGIVFLVMGVVPLALVAAGDRGALRRALLGDGVAEPEGRAEDEAQFLDAA